MMIYYKLKLLISASLFSMFFVLTQCKNDCDDPIPGEVSMVAHEGISSQSVYQLIEDSLGLKIKIDYQGSLNMFLLEVPEGTEEYWVNELRNYAIIKSTNFNYYSCG